jgi:hypothetical protein
VEEACQPSFVIPNGGFAVRNLLSLAALRVAAESRFLAALGMTTGLRWE